MLCVSDKKKQRLLLPWILLTNADPVVVERERESVLSELPIDDRCSTVVMHRQTDNRKWDPQTIINREESTTTTTTLDITDQRRPGSSSSSRDRQREREREREICKYTQWHNTTKRAFVVVHIPGFNSQRRPRAVLAACTYVCVCVSTTNGSRRRRSLKFRAPKWKGGYANELWRASFPINSDT